MAESERTRGRISMTYRELAHLMGLRPGLEVQHVTVPGPHEAGKGTVDVLLEGPGLPVVPYQSASPVVSWSAVLDSERMDDTLRRLVPAGAVPAERPATEEERRARGRFRTLTPADVALASYALAPTSTPTIWYWDGQFAARLDDVQGANHMASDGRRRVLARALLEYAAHLLADRED